MAKIVVVDDSASVRAQLKSLLEPGQHEVIEAVNGIDGLAKVKENLDARLIICDFNMPSMDGITMCKKIKEIEEMKKTVVLMLTTNSDPKMKALGKEAGILAWLVKPVNKDNFLTIINELLEKYKP